MKNRMIKSLLLTIILLLCGVTDGSSPFAVKPAKADAQDDAVSKAKSYISFSGFSREGLIDQLEFDGFTKEEAEYGADNCGADWNEMAVMKAKSYTGLSGFSRDGLVDQLEYEGFTNDQIAYALDALNNSSASEDPTNTPPAAPTEIPATVPDTAEVSEQMIDTLTENLDNIFVLRSLEDAFNSPMPAQYSDVGAATVVDISNQNGMRNISLYANADNVHDYSSVTKLNTGNLQNFYFAMEVRVNDIYPAGSGGCFIGYTNETTSAVQEEEIKTIGLLVDGSNAEFYIREAGADAGEHNRITLSAGHSYNLILIRFTGRTFAYINGHYAGQYNDELNGPFQLVYGTTVFSDGDNALCSFDNLNIRKVTN